MFEFVTRYLSERTDIDVARDLLDVFIVYYLTYRLLVVARGTRALQIAAGLGIVALLYLAAQQLELVTIVTLVGAVLQSIILVIVVVFQSDIRRALERVGSRAVLGGARAQETQVIEQVVEAAKELARHRIGAIITFEQDAKLDEFVGQNRGIDLDAKVSAELLVSLFVPEGSNKLHDGAVVIRDLRIARAGVFFPMPEGRSLESNFGSRHRAALGITEETDAVVVVVSEERGTISFCHKGDIASDLQAHQLRDRLFAVMSPKARQTAASRAALPSDRDSADRVSARSPEPKHREDSAGPSPSNRPPPMSQDAPRPLRKSSIPDRPKMPAELLPPPDAEDTDSLTVAVATPRPMPKATDESGGEDGTETTPRTPS